MSLNQLGIVKRNIIRADPAAVARLSKLGVATVHEAMGRVGLMKPYMRPIYPGAQLAGTAVTVLLHPGSPVSLPEDVFDGTSPFRNRLTWANLIAIVIVTPTSFVFNKLWTFSSVRGQVGGRGA